MPETWRGLTFAPLRKRGHSKEGRDNDPQVIVALAVTRDGMPVRSWVLPGDTADNWIEAIDECGFVSGLQLSAVTAEDFHAELEASLSGQFLPFVDNQNIILGSITFSLPLSAFR